MNDYTGFIQLDKLHRDLPKVKGAPKPQEPMSWTVYLGPSGEMRARFHPVGKFDFANSMDGILNDPLGFCQIVDAFRGHT